MTNPSGAQTRAQVDRNPLFAPEAKLTPYWWDHVPRPSLPEVEWPHSADVAIVGSGYTGLHAALQTARGGRHTVVFDAEDAGLGLQHAQRRAGHDQRQAEVRGARAPARAAGARSPS